MSSTSIVTHLPATPFTVLRLDYLIICHGDYCAAKMLSLFEAWTEIKQEGNEQAKYHNKAAAKDGKQPTHDETTWLYNTLDNIRQRMLGEYSVKTINKALKALIEWGFLKTRFNPKVKWDRTKQYQFQTQIVQAAIYKITPEQIEEYIEPRAETLDFLHLVNLPNASGKITKSIWQNYQIDLVDLPNRSGKITKTIPKSLNKESDQNNIHNAAPSPQQPAQKVRVSKKNNSSEPKAESDNNRVDEVEISSISPEKNGSSKSGFDLAASEEEVVAQLIDRINGLELDSAAVSHNDQIIQTLASLVAKKMVDNDNSPVDTDKLILSPQKPVNSSSRTEFQRWKQQIEPEEWEVFLNWKAHQAPASVCDRLGWAYNTLKADLERTRLSFESFKRERAKLQERENGSTSGDGASNFEAWSKERHIELAEQYLANNVTFLREKSWHKDWVEFVNNAFPDLFAEVSRGEI